MSTLTTRPATYRGSIRIGLALTAILGIYPSIASACSCLQPPTPDDAFDSDDAVFLATTKEVKRPPTRPDWYYELLFEIDERFGTHYAWQSNDVTVILQVDTAWKGVSTDRVSIRTGSGGGDCGYPFLEKQQYVVYASRYKGQLATSICSRTTPAHRASEDLAFLDDLSPLKLKHVEPVPWRLFVGSMLTVGCCLAVGLRLLGRRHDGVRS
jgi:hypothetical protein